LIKELHISNGERVIRKTGTGPANKLCLLLTRNDGRGVGLGDHVQSLPVIYELIKNGKEITVYASEFFRPLYEKAGCEFHPHNELMLTKDLLPNFGEVYSMIEWGIDDDIASHGTSRIDRTSLFASFFGIDRPLQFDFITALGAHRDDKLRDLNTVIYAPESSSSARTLNRQEQIYYKLKAQYSDTLWLGGIQCKEKIHIPDIGTLIDLIYNAKAIFTVDNGIVHIAYALGVPTMGVFGPTDENVICEPYNFYVPDAIHLRTYYRALPKASNECNAPCSFQRERGYFKAGKCKEFADCMMEIDTDYLLDSFHNFYSTLRSN
jgi:ADP-heptose:LPS heptosyltransferase